MTKPNSRQIFVNLPVKNLKRSMEFFSGLGFEFNMQFTDEKAACMIINENAFSMLLQESFFKSFMKNEICDTRSHTEVLLAFSCGSREEVDKIVQTAASQGGRVAAEPQDHGFMYQWSFYDPDGHHWEVMWMDERAMQGEAPAV